MTARRVLSAACVLATAVVLTGGCSNQQSSVNRRPHPGSATASSVDGAQQIDVTTGDTYRFDPSRITVRPGKVTVVLHNTGAGAPHNLTFLDFAAATPLATSGKTTSVTFTAPAPGQYQFVCTIHRAQGQTGTLVVQGD
jgi:plastocyanin